MFCKTLLLCLALFGVVLGAPHITISPYRWDAQKAYYTAAKYHGVTFLSPVFAQADFYDYYQERYKYFYLYFKADLGIFPTTVMTCYVEVSWPRYGYMKVGPKRCQ